MMNGKCREQIEKESYEITVDFLRQIPKIREYLEGDLQAALEGDPAANSYGEIILAYPGLLAITINRLAHELFIRSVPLIPRIMTEYAHSVTGIDIHPGATIGKHFFIDHGTGIVVGETTIIGNNVKIYQGVTLGALSTRGGQKLKNAKRHPTIEDNDIATKLITYHLIDMEEVIDARFPFEQGKEAFAAALKPGAYRVIIQY